MPCHDDVASEVAIFVVKADDRFTFGSGEEILQNRPSVGVEMLQEARPIEGFETSFNSPGHPV